jgi:hypothetical protein
MGTLALTLTLSLAVVAGCGGPAASAPTETSSARASWTSAQLRKLDPRLRERVRAGEREHVAVEVTFAHVPDEEVLGDLLLSRIGGMVVGRVELATLHMIAARDDVERIEVLADEGYDTL